VVGDVGVAAGELLHDGAELLGAGGELHGAGDVHHLDPLITPPSAAAGVPPGTPLAAVVVVRRRLGDAAVVVPVVHAQLAVHDLSEQLSVERRRAFARRAPTEIDRSLNQIKLPVVQIKLSGWLALEVWCEI